MSNIYLVKDLAAETGYSVETLKFYLKIRLIKEIARGIETNFRFFDDSTVDTLRNIRTLRKQGMSIEQIRVEINKNREEVR